jgi:L-seryl-tRNA(Ser) seleniumtransferase
LEKRAQRVIAVAAADGLVVEAGSSVLGAGSAPGAEVPSPLIVIAGDSDRVFGALLAGDPPVLARRDAGRVLIDLRAIPQSDDDRLAQALAAACRS